MARFTTNVPDRGSPSRGSGNDRSSGKANSLNRPPVRALITQLKAVYRAGETLDCAYRIDCESGQTIQSVETSVMWETDGKGDADIGVHFFEKRKIAGGRDSQLQEFRLETMLPPSPLSYDGWLVKLNWFIRIRIFLASGYHQTYNFPFKLHSALGEARLVKPSVNAE
ncbi:MAG: hypothetical protein ACK49R_16410 [Planctomycetota bacterium]